ncbi:MAG: DUF2309 domain-containing protein [Verrucomicrobia bacterium]|nr:DUF2309 domain-containing protein [Verrucomicrobiota bacterium]
MNESATLMNASILKNSFINNEDSPTSKGQQVPCSKSIASSGKPSLKEWDCALSSSFKGKKKESISKLVSLASDYIGPVWPLKNSIASNPLLGLEDKNFWMALAEYNALFSNSKSFSRTEEIVNRHFIKWIQAFLDKGQAAWKMPGRHLGFYRSWRMLARHDQLLIRSNRERKKFDLFPEDPEDAIQEGLKRFQIREEDKVKFLAGQLAQLSGWAGYVKYRTDWEIAPSQYPIDLVQFLAVRIVIRFVVQNDMKESDLSFGNQSYRHFWTKEKVEEEEKRYSTSLIQNLCSEVKLNSFSFRKNIPLGQLVFCIDVRSESFRKQLEKQGNWKTFGFAGFFGIPISLKNSRSKENTPSCPVLLRPRHDVSEMAVKNLFSRYFNKAKSAFIDNFRSLKYQFGTPFALAEAAGPWSGLWMTLKSLMPGLASFLQKMGQKNNKFCFVEIEKCIPLKDQIDYAQAALSMIGLTNDFASIVIFCGHGCNVQNNPHLSTLNCGACGGNAGGPNARLITSLLNSSAVRSELKKRGIDIPESTLFLAAQHDTTTDDVNLFWNEESPSRHAELISKLKNDLKQAQKSNAAIRMSQFESLKGVKEAVRKSIDWSDTRPEWGLAKNAGFIVGPRTLTQNLDLNGRCFLHSYDWRQDLDGSILETILTAPMIVAEWINTHYFFSTIDPILFGSGSKITHNVVGKIGVMQGNESDLMHGLPLQSTHLNDTEPYHIPIRLLSVVLAPKDKVEVIVNKHKTLQNLIFNEWVQFVAIDPSDSKAYKLLGQGAWHEISG